MNDSIKNFGGIKSSKDNRDFEPKHLGLGVPSSTPISWIQDISTIPVYMQNQQPACGGHAGAIFYNILDNLGNNLSPRFVYALCKKIDGLNGQSGTTGRAIMQVLQKYGVCTNDLFPNDTSLSEIEYADWTKISPEAYVDALNRRIGAYAQVNPYDFQTIKDAIYTNKIVLVLADIGREWWTDKNGNNSWTASDIFPLRPPESVVSGHFFVHYGFDKLYLYLRNSWSKLWGNNGNGYYGEDYVPYIIEIWIAQLPTFPVPPSTPIIQNEQGLQLLVSNTIQWLTSVKQWLSNFKN